MESLITPTSVTVADGSISLAMLNAVARQQSDGVTANAATVMAVTEMFSVAPAEIAASVNKTLKSSGAALDASTAPMTAAEGQPAVGEALAANGDAAANSVNPGGSHAPVTEIASMAARMMAQTVALRVQDAANYLRQVQTVTTAALGLSLMAQNAGHEAGDRPPSPMEILGFMDQCTRQFEAHFENMGRLLSAFLRNWPVDTMDAGRAEGDVAVPQLMVALQNAVGNQQQMNVTEQAATVQGVATLYSVDTASTGIATKAILGEAASAAMPQETPAPVA